MDRRGFLIATLAATAAPSIKLPEVSPGQILDARNLVKHATDITFLPYSCSAVDPYAEHIVRNLRDTVDREIMGEGSVATSNKRD
jgi:hypothetical protein